MAISKIGSRALEDASVATADIAPGSIGSTQLAGSIANAKLANSTITINGTAVALGASGTIPNIAWQSKVTSDGSTVTTMVAGRGYFVDNSSAAGIVKLPLSASAGDTIAIKDYSSNFGTNGLTIQRNGHKIQGATADANLTTNKASVFMVYVDSTKGWLFSNESNVSNLGPSYVEASGGTETTSGDFKIHTFTGDGNFVVSSVGNAQGSNTVTYLVVAGGGGGGGSGGGAGGGAGGYRTNHPQPSSCGQPVCVQTYPVTVGAGGAHNGGPSAEAAGSTGSASSAFGISSAGGGGGGVRVCGPAPCSEGNGKNGGSGGGGAQGRPVGSGNTPPVSPPQGNNGGPGGGNQFGGGGGAAAVGGSGSGSTPGTSGAGGAGSPNTISGSNTTYAGGGGGGISGSGGCTPAYTVGAGGAGGGGTGRMNTCGSFPYASATGGANTGGGGGGGGDAGANATGAPGGKGIVIVSYKYQN